MTLKKTSPKILFLIVSSSVVFLLLYAALFYYINKTEKEAYQNAVELFESKINQLLVLESKPILTALNNDTNWDEFVNFIATRDKSWYEETISNELEIYGADYLGVYDQDKQFIMRTPTPVIKTLDFVPESAMAYLDNVRVGKFYLQIPEGVVEITGATIHPSDDPFKNKSEPSGYFFAVRLINADFIRNLENITSSKIKFLATNDSIPQQRHIVSSVYLLKDFQGKPIGKLLFERKFDVYFENTISILYAIIIVFILYLIISVFYTQKLIYRPLYLVRKALQKESKAAIAELKKSSGEFSYIGNLFEENNNQKQALIKAKIKAEEGDLLKASFLANLSHEIRTPMNAINGFTELILNTDIDKKEQIEYLNVIQNNGKNLVSIIDDLIEMSKIDSNQVSPNFSEINLESCIVEVYKTLKITIPKTKAIKFKLIKSSVPAEHNIITDEIKLKQVIINLLTNAIKYTDEGFVKFKYEIDEQQSLIHFTIEDTGTGIEEDHQQHVFDRFKRVENDKSIQVGGLGLGLSISKAYIEILGGTIRFESKMGKGSTFYFSIPLQYVKSEPIIVKPIKEKEGMKSANKTILIAEDDNINFLLFQKMMKDKDFEIIRAKNGQEAVDICISNSNIDLVLMDIKMPVLNGFEAVEQIKPIRPELPIIAQTAYSSSEDRIKIEKAGFDDYITKPLSRERLFEMIDKY
ncbi:Signal transduction histidine kinase [Flavobacterium flevense]|uniref:ATP-binding protein n=1 Tax=Flavobacterium flevense TaxID=983 RepID=UPI0009234663|nr:ATP-binding protein [Flavobacterium flevense]SHL49262.1 Signal transduction histidine kinase [Flavobacterium flevense]